MLKIIIGLVSLLAISSPAKKAPAPFSVTGVIKEKDGGSPIQYVHVYTVKGEEEAVTNEKGEFSFQTWRQNAQLATEKDGYQHTSKQVHFPSSKQTILLQKE